MRKLLIIGLLSLALTGCGGEEIYTKIESTITVTDVKIDLEIKEGGRHEMPSQTVSYGKQGEEMSKKYKVDYSLSRNIEKIKKMEDLTDSEEALYDIITDGDNILMITLSKNRK